MTVHSMLINKTKTESWRLDEEYRCTLLDLRHLVAVFNFSVTPGRISNDGDMPPCFMLQSEPFNYTLDLVPTCVTSGIKNILNSGAHTLTLM